MMISGIWPLKKIYTLKWFPFLYVLSIKAVVVLTNAILVNTRYINVCKQNVYKYFTRDIYMANRRKYKIDDQDWMEKKKQIPSCLKQSGLSFYHFYCTKTLCIFYHIMVDIH